MGELRRGEHEREPSVSASDLSRRPNEDLNFSGPSQSLCRWYPPTSWSDIGRVTHDEIRCASSGLRDLANICSDDLAPVPPSISFQVAFGERGGDRIELDEDDLMGGS